jgi:HEPN domain
MSDLDHARSLLEMAKGDLNALRGMTSPALALIPELFSDPVFGFHAQQAVERCLKAWIASLGQRYTRIHDLMALIEDLENAGEDTSERLGFVDLNTFAVQYRGEGSLDHPAALQDLEPGSDPLDDLQKDRTGGPPLGHPADQPLLDSISPDQSQPTEPGGGKKGQGGEKRQGGEKGRH